MSRQTSDPEPSAQPQAHSPAPASHRSAEYIVSIAAPPEAVWKALTDPRELERWFPLAANITPGAGGHFTLRWRDAHSGDDWPIFEWDPLHHLQIGMPKPGGAPAPAHVLTDFVLEDKGGSTVLRVVASGFDPDAKWDSFFHGIRRGWRFELRGLRHYLERHRGKPRVVAWARSPFKGTNDKMWSTFFGKGGWVPDKPIETLREGDHYRLTGPDGFAVSGTVYIVDRPTDFTGSVDELGGAVLRVQLEAERGGNQVSLWVAAWGVPQERMDALQGKWQERLSAISG